VAVAKMSQRFELIL